MPAPCRRHRDTVPCPCRAWDETEHHLGGGGGADPTRGRSRDPVGYEPDFLTDRPHRPTRLSLELEEVDAVRPVFSPRSIGSIAPHPEVPQCDSSDSTSTNARSRSASS